jgi:hypothetical protein
VPADRVTAWDVQPEPAQVTDIRDQVARRLADWHLQEFSFTELVTNAIRYAQPPIRLRPIHNHKALIIEVSDASSTAPHLR